MDEIEMTDVTSSNVAAIGYDAKTGTLRVRFHGGGTWDYAGVAQDVYKRLQTTGSIGSFVAREIKPNYAATRHTERKQA